jgi:hypothetical protein
MYKLRQLTHKLNKVRRTLRKVCELADNSYSWTLCLFSMLNTIKEIRKESLKQWTYNTHTIVN